MSLSRADVRHLARLARLRLTDPEADALAVDLDRIVGYVGTVQAVDTTGVEPTTHGLRPEAGPPAAPRADVPADPLPRAAALAPAPDADGTFVRVPRTVG